MRPPDRRPATTTTEARASTGSFAIRRATPSVIVCMARPRTAARRAGPRPRRTGSRRPPPPGPASRPPPAHNQLRYSTFKQQYFSPLRLRDLQEKTWEVTDGERLPPPVYNDGVCTLTIQFTLINPPSALPQKRSVTATTRRITYQTIYCPKRTPLRK